ncbi:hypothetical protein GWK47_013905 [Chionoecetes opilio]|uniref:Uncharacterized protein n=1 Tax=Chionoecetes opilio TaxID=41210 RepID=A0A8J5CL99_CHIOP|nr:hypothetical protein GWK47_013905 [Chionoecetes opilio]
MSFTTFTLLTFFPGPFGCSNHPFGPLSPQVAEPSLYSSQGGVKQKRDSPWDQFRSARVVWFKTEGNIGFPRREGYPGLSGFAVWARNVLASFCHWGLLPKRANGTNPVSGTLGFSSFCTHSLKKTLGFFSELHLCPFRTEKIICRSIERKGVDDTPHGL